MSSISFQNSQNVNIQFQKATITSRIGAFLIDTVMLVAFFGFPFLFIDDYETAALIWLAIVGIVSLMYHLVCETFLDGQSLGKKAMKIKVVSMDGRSITFSQLVLRWLFRFVDIALLQGIIAVLTILIGGKGQRVGDIVAGTLVISLDEDTNAGSFSIPKFEDDYEPVFFQASSLNQKQLDLIKKTLKLDYSTDHLIVIYKVENKLKEQLMIEQTTLKHKNFLRQLLNDYYYLTIKSQEQQVKF